MEALKSERRHPIDVLTTRASAIRLGEPAPAGADLDRILAAAARAPDHGRLRPWRFIVVRGAARGRLGDVMAEALAAREGGIRATAVERERGKPLRAPLIVVVAARVQPDHPRIPEIEQVVSAGCAAHAMLLAAHALGYGAMWKTGAPAYDERVKAALGLAPEDRIVAFVYLGTAQGPPASEAVRPGAADFVREWDGPA